MLGKGVRSVIVACATSLLLATGCGDDSSSPTGVVKGFVSSLQQMDLQKAASYLKDQSVMKDYNQLDDNNPLTKPLETLFEKDKVEVTGEKIDGNKATVSVKVSAPDMRVVMGKVMGDALASAFAGTDESTAQKAMAKTMLDQLNSPDCPTVDTEAQVLLEKVNDEWKLSGENKEFMNAMSGRMEDWAQGFADSMGSLGNALSNTDGE